jgi:sodium/proline symporter
MAAIMAAIMSTADSILLQAGTIASQDLGGTLIKNLSEKAAVNISRIVIFVIAVVGLILAMVRPPGVFDLVVFATSTMGSAFVPAYVCAVWWKKANTPGAIISMLAGAAAAVTAQIMGTADSWGIDPMMAGIVASTVGIIVGSLATQRSHPVPPQVLAAVEETMKVAPVPKHLVIGEDATLASQRPQDSA